MAQNVVLCRVMAACCASLGSGRRAAGGVRGRSVGAEPMKGGAAHGVDARGLVGERGLGDGLLTLHVYLPVCLFFGSVLRQLKHWALFYSLQFRLKGQTLNLQNTEK